MEGALTVFGLLVGGFAIFLLYFVYKLVQFTLVSVNLYEKMVSNQDAMVKLLTDLRDHTKTYTLRDRCDEGDLYESVSAQERNERSERDDDAGPEFCFHCGEEITDGATKCPACGKRL